MTFSSHKFNEIVFQLLFSLDMGESNEEDLIPFLMRELSVTRKTVRDAFDNAKRVYEARKELDETIASISKGYEFERIGRVERNIIRFALYELSTQSPHPREMVISEALRITRKFSTKEAVSYVNALLDESNNGERPSLFTPKTETAK
ncbi:MAG: transcription antitermination factor NusB [Chlamydiales bacterium]|nr:transcription antitermination factor NusB [Chlamydiales bacterium]